MLLGDESGQPGVVDVTAKVKRLDLRQPDAGDEQQGSSGNNDGQIGALRKLQVTPENAGEPRGRPRLPWARRTCRVDTTRTRLTNGAFASRARAILSNLSGTAFICGLVQFEVPKGSVIPNRGLAARGICCSTGWQQADSLLINLASERRRVRLFLR